MKLGPNVCLCFNDGEEMKYSGAMLAEETKPDASVDNNPRIVFVSETALKASKKVEKCSLI